MTDAPRDRREKLERLHTLLVDSVQAVQSSDDWQRLLDFAGRFHHYSFDNQLLIAVQHEQAFHTGRVSEPQPSYVAGFHTWKTLGRCVDKGQRGYAILAPVSYRARHPQAAGDTIAADGGEDRSDGDETAGGPKLLRGFTVAHVFDVSQTSGQPIPQPPRPRLLEGDAPDGLAEQLTSFLTSQGFEVRSVPDAAVIGGANGVTDFTNHTVLVRADIDPAARVKTLAHETGHVLLHDPSTNPDQHLLGLKHRGRAEVEAESVAYVITSASGMDPSGYSLPYVATWAGTDKPADVVRATARRVVSAAHQVLDALSIESAGGHPPDAAPALTRSSPPRSILAEPLRANKAVGL